MARRDAGGAATAATAAAAAAAGRRLRLARPISAAPDSAPAGRVLPGAAEHGHGAASTRVGAAEELRRRRHRDETGLDAHRGRRRLTRRAVAAALSVRAGRVEVVEANEGEEAKAVPAAHAPTSTCREELSAAPAVRSPNAAAARPRRRTRSASASALTDGSRRAWQLEQRRGSAVVGGDAPRRRPQAGNCGGAVQRRGVAPAARASRSACRRRRRSSYAGSSTRRRRAVCRGAITRRGEETKRDAERDERLDVAGRRRGRCSGGLADRGWSLAAARREQGRRRRAECDRRSCSTLHQPHAAKKTVEPADSAAQSCASSVKERTLNIPLRAGDRRDAGAGAGKGSELRPRIRPPRARAGGPRRRALRHEVERVVRRRGAGAAVGARGTARGGKANILRRRPTHTIDLVGGGAARSRRRAEHFDARRADRARARAASSSASEQCTLTHINRGPPPSRAAAQRRCCRGAMTARRGRGRRRLLRRVAACLGPSHAGASVGTPSCASWARGAGGGGGGGDDRRPADAGRAPPRTAGRRA